TFPGANAAPANTPLLPLTESTALLSALHQLTRPATGGTQAVWSESVSAEMASTDVKWAEAVRNQFNEECMIKPSLVFAATRVIFASTVLLSRLIQVRTYS